MGDYDKKIEGQCGTCEHAVGFGSADGPSGPEDGVHCNSLELAKALDGQENSDDPDMVDLRDHNQKELAEYGHMELWRLECLAEETYRCNFWKESKGSQC